MYRYTMFYGNEGPLGVLGKRVARTFTSGEQGNKSSFVGEQRNKPSVFGNWGTSSKAIIFRDICSCLVKIFSSLTRILNVFL